MREKSCLLIWSELRPSLYREARMKEKKWSLVLIGLILLTSLSAFGETKKLRDIGRYRFLPIQAGISKPEMTKAILENYTGDIQRGFELSGYPNLYGPFIDQVRGSAFTERELAVGARMLWMLFRSQGQIKIIEDLEWAGREPLQVFSFTIQEGDKKYEIIIPKSCGNLALERVETAVPAQEEKPAAPAPSLQEKPEDRYQITRAKIYQELADLINEVDLYCSFFIWENEIPDLRIIGAPQQYAKSMFSDGDVIYFSKGKDGGVEPGQIFWILDIGEQLPGFGTLAFGRGRARVQFAYDNTSAAVIEHCCGGVREGNFLVPFEEREGMTGKDLGFDFPPVEAEGVKGRVVYTQDLRLLGSYYWALIDIGQEQGIQVGQQLILYRRIREDLPIVLVGNSVVIDVRSKTATIKVLSCRDVVQKGYLVMERPPQ
jgi:hypothetical protein